MSDEKMKIGEVTKPRFEFRTFGQDFEEVHYRMSRLSEPLPEHLWERHSDELYIMSRTNDINNTKIRDGKMDIKSFIQNKEGLEQWNPLLKTEFPVSGKLLNEEIFPAFKVDFPGLGASEYTYSEFRELVDEHPALQAVRVSKFRLGYMINNTICEVATVLINGARVITVNTESTEIADIKKTIEDVGLSGFENINYLQAIKRVIGMIDKPLADESF